MSRALVDVPAAVHRRAAPPARNWFLINSKWSDACWVFSPTSSLEEEHPVRIRWDLRLIGPVRFTNHSSGALLESARRCIAIIRTRSITTGLPQRSRTVRGFFYELRLLVRWMTREGVRRFADFDSAMLLTYRGTVTNRRRRDGKRIVPLSVERSVRLLMYLHRHRAEIGDGLTFDPCPGQAALTLIGGSSEQGALPYTPDVVAVPLIQRSIEYLETSAFDLLCARERCVKAYEEARGRGLHPSTCHLAALKAVRTRQIHTPSGTITLDSLVDFGALIDVLYSACFVVISYLVGPRVSEILRLREGCVKALKTSDDRGVDEIALIVGAIFKREHGYHGRPHEWVAPPPAVHAVYVLEALSAPHRQQTGRQSLWLRTGSRQFGSMEWQSDTVGGLPKIPHTDRINNALGRLAEWLRLPMYQGKPWRLSTHQGRKTFARFVALRDRTGLFALAQHLGHRDRTVTDTGYSGSDYALATEIEAHVLDQSVSAWEHMLSAPVLGGRAGAEILAKRPRFRGARMKQDLRSYARLLVEAGLTLGVCDWGFCVYRQEHSACLGTASAPNPIRREPSTCARCRNFVVGEKHRPYWQEQVLRHETLLNEPALPTQTLKIVRDRLTEATVMLRSIDSADKRSQNDANNSP
jgi:integrase